MDAEGPGFTVAALILWDAAGRVLSVRKRGTESFMLPGGKIEPGETSDATAVREVEEELGLQIPMGELRFVGGFLTDAANEPGHWLRSDVFAYPYPVTGGRPAAEIAEARWIDPDDPGHVVLAPLFVELLPVLRGGAGLV